MASTTCQLCEKTYRDKVFACWLGKNIGGTLGAPFECRKYVNDLTFYHQLPKNATANDDLDLQLVWLQMLEEVGIGASLPDFAEYWMRHLAAYPWNEYGYCMKNLARGLRPPISGCFENYFVDEMGSPIRSEIWACSAPGDPQLAAELAWNDSALDHAGGEGTRGEMFWAAVQSAAFVLKDPRELIKIGLAMIPVSSGIARATRDALWCAENGLNWARARNHLVTYFGHHQPCNAVANQGFTILGLLYGENFGDALCKAVNCGYDTDCTGATLGALLGIMDGTRAIPKKWRAPIGERILLHQYTRLKSAPKTIAELTRRTLAVARRMLGKRSDIMRLGKTARLPKDRSWLFRNERATAALAQDIHAAHGKADGYRVVFHYGGEPVLEPNVERRVGVAVFVDGRQSPAHVELRVPKGWNCRLAGRARSGRTTFAVRSPKPAKRNWISVRFLKSDGQWASARFVILGPQGRDPQPAGVQVKECPKCHARVEACVCQRS